MSLLPRIIVARKWDKDAVYIGRGSPFGNPFKMNSEAERGRVCEQYQAWFDEQIKKGNPKLLAGLRDLYRKAREEGELRLGCFCAPKRCHGDTIKVFLDNALKKVAEKEGPDQFSSNVTYLPENARFK